MENPALRRFAAGVVAGLQFGHGAEAVENIGVLISGGVAALMLQFGHGAEAVENPEVAVRRLLAGVASIRPRR